MQIQKRYCYDPVIKEYYRILKRLALASGRYANCRAILVDLSSGVKLNPKREKAYKMYFNSNLDTLKRSISTDRDEMNWCWHEMRNYCRKLGLDLPTKDETKAFCSMIESPEKDCDFRTKLHGWLNSDLRSLDAGIAWSDEFIDSQECAGVKIIKFSPKTVKDFLAKYELLCKKRRA